MINSDLSVENHLPPVSPTSQDVKPGDNSTSVKNNKIAELFRRSTSHQLQCSMFCGGRKCKYETGSVWKDKDKAIPIIYSHWITDDLLAMSRPNTILIEQFDLINLFKKHNIRTVVNLQEPGEHANCGSSFDESSRFSYDPKVFMDNDIYFYNFQWKDFSDIALDSLVDMVKVVTFALLQGKVSVHCHAGLGRTGTLIAAYLIYTYRCQAQNAINFVRSRRPNSIQSKSQISILFQFANYISPCFIVFNQVSTYDNRVLNTLKEFLKRQNLLLHGQELRILRYIPKIMFVICEKLIQLSSTAKEKETAGNGDDNFTFDYLGYKSCKQIQILSGKNDPLHQNDPDSESAPAQESNDSNEFNQKMIDSLVSRTSEDDESATDFKNMLQDDVIAPEALAQHRASFVFENDALLKVNPDQNDPMSSTRTTKQVVIQTLIDQPKSDHKLILKIYEYQKEINNRPSGWNRLRNENNVEILCSLLLSWMENLDQAILDEKTIGEIIIHPENHMKCFYRLDQEIRFTVEFLARFIIKLSDGQIDLNLRKRLIARLVASLSMKKTKFQDGQTIEILPHLPKPQWTFLRDQEPVIDFLNVLIQAIITKDY